MGLGSWQRIPTSSHRSCGPVGGWSWRVAASPTLLLLLAAQSATTILSYPRALRSQSWEWLLWMTQDFIPTDLAGCSCKGGLGRCLPGSWWRLASGRLTWPVGAPPLILTFSREGQHHAYVGWDTHKMQEMQKTIPFAAELQKNIPGVISNDIKDNFTRFGIHTKCSKCRKRHPSL